MERGDYRFRGKQHRSNPHALGMSFPDGQIFSIAHILDRSMNYAASISPAERPHAPVPFVTATEREFPLFQLGTDSRRRAASAAQDGLSAARRTMATEACDRFKISRYVEKGDTDEDTCVICQDAFRVNDELMHLPCEHLFHSQCIVKWLTEGRAVCPFCRCIVSASNGSNISAHENYPHDACDRT